MAYEILDRIQTPEDLRALSERELNTLCGEIRAFLLEHVSKTGGHLASNLGVVELTLALHHVFDVPRREAYAQRLQQPHLRSLTRLFVRLQELNLQMVWR